MTHEIQVHPAAVKSLRRVQGKDRLRIEGAIALLAQDPYPPNATKLRGREAFRVRVGDYRIIYTVDNNVLLVTVIKLGHRRDVYH